MYLYSKLFKQVSILKKLDNNYPFKIPFFRIFEVKFIYIWLKLALRPIWAIGMARPLIMISPIYKIVPSFPPPFIGLSLVNLWMFYY